MNALKSAATNPLRLCVVGADGKMGKTLLQQIFSASRHEMMLSSAVVLADSPFLGKTVGSIIGNDCDIILQSDLENAIAKAEVLIDFTRPEGTLAFLPLCQKHHVAMVIGTTGLDNVAQKKLMEAAKDLPMLVSTNMAPGVNVLFHLVKQAAGYLPHFDAEVVEIHHRHKVDAPSGTALTLGEQILMGRGEIDSKANAVKRREALMLSADFVREGRTGSRQQGRVGFSAVRGGDVVGEHTVMLLGDGERLELRHVSTQRHHYATGALMAAQFLRARPPGFYSMQDVLNLSH